MIGMVPYYRFTLALPLVVAAVLYVAGAAIGAPPSGVGGVLWTATVIGGIPYSTLASFMFFWIRGRSEKAIHTVIYLSPFFMVVLLSFVVALFFPGLRGRSALSHSARDAVVRYSLLGLAIGYLYVATVQLTYLALKATNRIALPGRDPGNDSRAPRRHRSEEGDS